MKKFKMMYLSKTIARIYACLKLNNRYYVIKYFTVTCSNLKQIKVKFQVFASLISNVFPLYYLVQAVNRLITRLLFSCCSECL